MKLLQRLPAAIVITLGAMLCRAGAQEITSGGNAGAVTVYDAHGVLKAYDPATHQATISHDAIPGYMQAMTMAFDARSPDDFASLGPGDILSFHLCVTSRTAWIDHVVKTGATSPLLEPPGASRPVRQLIPGDSVPDVQLTDQSGKLIHLRDFKGEAIAITFIYTRCPLPTYCPLMISNFAETESLMTRMAPGGHWRLLCISMDPAHDTPTLLASFASGIHANPADWSFATGDEGKVKKFGAAFGLEFQQTGPRISHNLRTLVLDADGHLRGVYPGNAWTPQQLASDLSAAMRQSTLPAKEETP